jgi:DNA modification methylase
VTDNEIHQVQYDAQADYIATLKGLKTIDRPSVFKQYQQIRSKIKSQTREQAEKDQAYYKNEANRKEAEEQARIEWEQFMPKNGQWYEVGPHRLYCGDNTDQAFIDGLPNKAKFAFADPPYNEDVDEWDSGFIWSQDYLADIAEFVVVTPGISAIFDFARLTNMPYKWSLAAWISNGMTRGALGFGNWIYGALFSKKESVHLTAQDFKKINIQTSGNADHYHKGKKPDEYMDWLLSTFCEEGDKVIDPFLGSGTTLLRADAKGLFCFGAEKTPEYCKKIIAQYKNTQNA